MITNGTIDSLCGELQEFPFQRRKIVERVRKRGGMYFNQYRMYFSELQINFALKAIARRHPEWKVDLSPIKAWVSGDLRMICDKRGIIITDNNRDPSGHRTLAEYDGVISVDDVPVIFEVKIANPSEIRRAIKKADKKISSLSRFLDGDMAYVLVVPKDNYRRQTFENFRRKSGKVVSFYTTLKDFEHDVFRTINEFGLSCRDINEVTVL